MIETVTVMPEERIVSLGTSMSLMRTGMRCARRTYSKVALTFCSKLLPVGFCVSPIPRAMLSTSPLIDVEQASTFGWERYVGEKGRVIGMHTFGASAPLKEIDRKFGFEPERVVEVVKDLLAAGRKR